MEEQVALLEFNRGTAFWILRFLLLISLFVCGSGQATGLAGLRGHNLPSHNQLNHKLRLGEQRGERVQGSHDTPSPQGQGILLLLLLPILLLRLAAVPPFNLLRV